MNAHLKNDAYTPFLAMVATSNGIAVSVDADNTGESSASDFGDIEFVAGTKR